MSVRCPSTITFTPTGGDPITLVAEGAWLVSQPRFEASQQIYEQDGYGAAEGYFKPLGGVVVTITIDIEEETENLHDRFLDAEILDGVNLLQVEGELVISNESGTATYSPAVASSIAPGLPFELVGITRGFLITAALPTVEDA